MTCENCGKEFNVLGKHVVITMYPNRLTGKLFHLCWPCRLSASEVIAKKEKETP
jgi:hypothetical protein